MTDPDLASLTLRAGLEDCREGGKTVISSPRRYRACVATPRQLRAHRSAFDRVRNMTIRLQQQGLDECFPTVVAMLAGVSTDEVVSWARARYRFVSWSRLTDSYAEFWLVAEAVLDHFLYPDAGREHLAGSVSLPGVAPWGRPEPRRSLPSRGRGLVTIRTPDDRSQHIAAFASGRVYDPAFDEPMPYRRWLGAFPGWSVIAIHVLRGKTIK